MEAFAVAIYYYDVVARVQVAQGPEYGGVAAWPVEVAVDDCAALSAWTGAEVVPACVVPGMLGGGCHVAIGERSQGFDEGVDANCGDDEAGWVGYYCRWLFWWD